MEKIEKKSIRFTVEIKRNRRAVKTKQKPYISLTRINCIYFDCTHNYVSNHNIRTHRAKCKLLIELPGWRHADIYLCCKCDTKTTNSTATELTWNIEHAFGYIESDRQHNVHIKHVWETTTRILGALTPSFVIHSGKYTSHNIIGWICNGNSSGTAALRWYRFADKSIFNEIISGIKVWKRNVCTLTKR